MSVLLMANGVMLLMEDQVTIPLLRASRLLMMIIPKHGDENILMMNKLKLSASKHAIMALIILEALR